MNGNAELLNFVYQNSQMGRDTIHQLMERTEDQEFKKQLEKQMDTYDKFHKKSREMLNKNGYDEKGISTFSKIKTYLMINFQTMTDSSTSHLAEMMVLGSNMGVVDAIKNVKKYDDADKDILKLMEELKVFEEENVERIKNFL